MDIDDNPGSAPTMDEIRLLWRTSPEEASRYWCDRVGLVFTEFRPAAGNVQTRPPYELDAVRLSCGHSETFSVRPWVWSRALDPCPTCYDGVTLIEARAREWCKHFELEFLRFAPRIDTEGSVTELSVRMQCGHSMTGRWISRFLRNPFCPTCEQETAERWFLERNGQLLTWQPPKAFGLPALVAANKPCGHWMEGRWPGLRTTGFVECLRCEIEDKARSWCEHHELELRRCDTTGSSGPTTVVCLRACGHVEVHSNWTNEDEPEARCRSCASPSDLRAEWAEEHGVVLTELADLPSASSQITYRLGCGHIQSQSFYVARRRGPRPCRKCAPTAEERAVAWCDEHDVTFVNLDRPSDNRTQGRIATLTYVPRDCEHTAKVPWRGAARTKLESACAECQIEIEAARAIQLTFDLQ